ncbi:MAG: ComF family protein [Akkermansiaceae bacterium]
MIQGIQSHGDNRTFKSGRVKSFASRILDYIYPAQCHLCKRSLNCGTYLCNTCSKSLDYTEHPFCQLCGEAYEGDIRSDFSCHNCHNLSFDFEFARAPLHASGDGRTLLHDYKYRRLIHLTGDLGDLLHKGLSDPRFTPYLNSGILVPVPLHWTRQRKRRFNQAEELSLHLSKRTGMNCRDMLERKRKTTTQTRFNRSRRLENLSGAFALKPRFQEEIQGRHIILVDDIFTTGSTANACARVLLKSGATQVAVLTLLRG